jgi:hypothetical protein
MAVELAAITMRADSAAAFFMPVLYRGPARRG